jgi:hypothetical protein
MEKTYVPNNYYQTPLSVLEDIICKSLIKMTDENDNQPLNNNNLSRFYSRAKPSISIPAYINRITQYASIEKSTLLTVLLYIDRIYNKKNNFIVNSLTIHRFLIAAITVGSKILCDSYCTNNYYV